MSDNKYETVRRKLPNAHRGHLIEYDGRLAEVERTEGGKPTIISYVVSDINEDEMEKMMRELISNRQASVSNTELFQILNEHGYEDKLQDVMTDEIVGIPKKDIERVQRYLTKKKENEALMLQKSTQKKKGVSKEYDIHFNGRKREISVTERPVTIPTVENQPLPQIKEKTPPKQKTPSKENEKPLVANLPKPISKNTPESLKDIKSFVKRVGIEEKNIMKQTQNVFDGQCVRKKSNWVVVKDEHKFDHPKFNPSEMKDAIPSNSPKLEALLKKIAELDKKDMETDGHLYKHFIYSDIRVNGYGAKMVTSGLVANGFKLGYTAKLNANNKHGKIEMLPRGSDGEHTFYLLASINVYDKPLPVGIKRAVLDNFNSRPDNVHGDVARIIVMDSGYKEGIDLFDIKYIHIFEPPLQNADQKQIIGRGTRTCGQKGLQFHPTMGWPLYVYIYDVTIPEEHRPEFMGSKSLFDLYIKSTNIDLRFFEFQKDLERLVVYGSVDYDLNRAIHNFSTHIDNADSFVGGAGDEPRQRPPKQKVEKKVWQRPFTEAVKYGKLPQILTDKSGSRFEKMKQYILHYYSDYQWKNIKMENLCSDKPKGGQRTRRQKMHAGSKETDKKATNNKTKKNNPPVANPLKVFPTDTGDKYVSRFPANVIPGYNQVVYNKGKESKSNSEEEKEKEEEAKRKPFLQFTPTQDFVSHYFTPELPLKGMLLWHSVGTGKTCTAIATATNEFEKQGYTILWVTKATLKSEIYKNVFDQICSLDLRRRIETEGLEIPTDPKKRLQTLSPSWNIQPISYKQLSNLVEGRNQFYTQIRKKNPKSDPLYKTLLIIDEAQKLYGATDLVYTERPDMNSIEKAIQNSYEVSGDDSVKLLLMSATPITNSPMEIIKLINLTKPYHEHITTHFEEFSARFLDQEGHFTQEGQRDFLNMIAGTVSYLNREKDARQFSQPIIKRVNVPLAKHNSELMEYDPNYVKEVAKSEINQLQDQIKKNEELIDKKYKRITKSSFDYVKDECKELPEGEEKSKCLQEAKAKIDELQKESNQEMAELKKSITAMKKEIKEVTAKRKNKLEELKDYFKKNPDKAKDYMKSMYYGLQDECAKVAAFDNLGPYIEKHPDILRYEEELKYYDNKVVELRKKQKIMVDDYNNHLAQLAEQLNQPGIKKSDKDIINKTIASVKREMAANTSDKVLIAETRILMSRKKQREADRENHKKTLRNQVKQYFERVKKRREEIEEREFALRREKERQEELLEKLRLQEEKKKQQEEENRRKEEEKKRKQEEDKRKKEEEKKKKQEEARIKKEEENKKKEEEKKKKEEEKKKKEEEEKRKKEEENKKKEEEKKKKQEEARIKKEEENRKKEEEKRRKQEEKKQKDEEEKRKKKELEEEKKRNKNATKNKLFPVIEPPPAPFSEPKEES